MGSGFQSHQPLWPQNFGVIFQLDYNSSAYKNKIADVAFCMPPVVTDDLFHYLLAHPLELSRLGTF